MGIGRRFIREYADVWLHAKRIRALMLSYISTSVNITLWTLLYVFILYAVYGVSEARNLVPAVYAWAVYDFSTMSVAGWMRYFLSIQMPELLAAYGRCPFATLAYRIIASVAFIIPSLTLAILMTGVTPSSHTILSLLLALLFGHAYGLFLSALASKHGVSYFTIDVLNFVAGLVGGMLIPLRDMPELLRIIALAIPLSYMAELARFDYGAAVLTPSICIEASIAWITVAYVAAYLAVLRATRDARRNGWRSPML